MTGHAVATEGLPRFGSSSAGSPRTFSARHTATGRAFRISRARPDELALMAPCTLPEQVRSRCIGRIDANAQSLVVKL